MNRSLAPILVLAALAAGAAPLLAQKPAPPDRELVERIVAVVGDSVITDLDVQEDMAQLVATGQPAPQTADDSARLRDQIVKSHVSELLLVQAALEDTTITPPEDQIKDQVQQEISARQKQFPSAAAFEAALHAQGLTLNGYREMIAADMRKTALIQRYLSKVEQNRKPAVTEEEMKAFFDEQKGRLGQRPATISFEQVVIAPQPSDSAMAAARAQAEEILQKVHAGEDFATLAKRYSQDPGTKEKGGDLGWFRRGQMVKAFEDAAYSLRPGEVSGIVRSPFGLHIIKLEKIKGGEREARHILIRPEITDADTTRAVVLADSVKLLMQRGEDMDSLIATYSDPTEEQTKVGPFPRDQLPAAYSTALADANAGQVIGPIRLVTQGQPTKYAVVKVTESTPAGQYTLDDPTVHATVREQVARQKLLDELVAELKDKMYVDIRS